jgi:hypothetical protein
LVVPGGVANTRAPHRRALSADEIARKTRRTGAGCE